MAGSSRLAITSGHWHNWSGSVGSTPRQIARPGSTNGLVRMIEEFGRDGRYVRVVGSSHSFTPLVQTDDVLMSLDNLQGIEKIDAEHGRMTGLGGTKLKHLGDVLYAHGLAQENLGDINVQSIAGAISTGTHGTGVRFGSLATQVEGLTLVTASGELPECSPEHNPDIFKAVRIGAKCIHEQPQNWPCSTLTGTISGVSAPRSIPRVFSSMTTCAKFSALMYQSQKKRFNPTSMIP